MKNCHFFTNYVGNGWFSFVLIYIWQQQDLQRVESLWRSLFVQPPWAVS